MGGISKEAMKDWVVKSFSAGGPSNGDIGNIEKVPVSNSFSMLAEDFGLDNSNEQRMVVMENRLDDEQTEGDEVGEVVVEDVDDQGSQLSSAVGIVTWTQADC
ncbi:hypothetical protein C2S52_018697 [Perilla frutescens var. hirtella]|nr:hypothetical protein C2S52_018697 [Perilla frutescens var. hirtella]KAH6812373.1 hypothetical protein C2S51_026135 [Perilla frutescens var. frutescens]